MKHIASVGAFVLMVALMVATTASADGAAVQTLAFHNVHIRVPL